LEESELLRDEDYHALFENLPYPVIIRHLELGRYVFVNQAFERAFGFPRAEILGRRPDELNLCASREIKERLVQKVQKGQARMGESVPVRTRDGRVIDCTLRASPVVLGDSILIVGILTEPSEIIARV